MKNKYEVRYASSPREVKQFDTDELRKEFFDHAEKSILKSVAYLTIVCSLFLFYVVFIPGFMYWKGLHLRSDS